MASKLILDVLVDVKGAEKLKGLSGTLQRTGRNLTTFVTLPLAGAAVAAFNFASDADESMSKAQTVFGDAFGSIADDAASMDDAFSEAKFLDAAGTFGAIAQGMGATTQESADLSAAWLGMAQDFASFNNVPIEESLTAIRAALSGEFEPLKRFGVLLNVAKVEAKAVEMGLISQGEALDDNSRLLATNALILEGMGPALGDYSRTAEGAANSTRNLAANSADLGADLGQTLLPIGQQIIGMLQGAVAAFTALPAPVQQGIVVVAGFAAALGPLLLVGRQLITVAGGIRFAILHIPTALGYVDLALGKVTAAFNILKVALLTNPFIALAAAVIAIAALVILNWDKIVKSFQNLWRDITNTVENIKRFLGDAWDVIVSVATTAWAALEGIVKGSLNALIDVINGFFGFLNGLQFGAGPWDVGPIHIDAVSIDPFNIGLIPHLASGGIVTAPTLALIAERGPEAVIPLDNFRAPTEVHRHTHLTVLGPLRADDFEDVMDYERRVDRLERAMDWEPA